METYRTVSHRWERRLSRGKLSHWAWVLLTIGIALTIALLVVLGLGGWSQSIATHPYDGSLPKGALNISLALSFGPMAGGGLTRH